MRPSSPSTIRKEHMCRKASSVGPAVLPGGSSLKAICSFLRLGALLALICALAAVLEEAPSGSFLFLFAPLDPFRHCLPSAVENVTVGLVKM